MPHRIESPFSFRLAEKITGVPGGTVPVRYGEAKEIFSLLPQRVVPTIGQGEGIFGAKIPSP